MSGAPPLPGCLLPSSAILSPCGTYRYLLTRAWADGKAVCWIMLNPSTADAEQDDPTIRRCIAFTKAWGHGRLWVVNAYPFRSPHPRELAKWSKTTHAGKPLGEMLANSDHVIDAAKKASLIICAWGAAAPDEGPDFILHRLRADSIAVHHIGLTADGSPKHPLARGKHRIPDTQRPIAWRY